MKVVFFTNSGTEANEAAIKFARKYQRYSNPNDAEAYYNRGNAYSDLKNYSQAISDYNQAIKLNPNHHNFDREGNGKRGDFF